MSTSVYLSLAVGCYVAQDLWHLLEHGQTIDMDLQEELHNNDHQTSTVLSERKD